MAAHPPQLLFVTGKLAEPSLRRLLADLGPRAHFRPCVAVLPISVVSLATTDWIARHLPPQLDIEKAILPGLCAGPLAAVEEVLRVPVVRGPADLRDLPEFFGLAGKAAAGLDDEPHDIAIYAEINHAPRLTLTAILQQAQNFRDASADVIDLGCDPGTTWDAVGPTVRALRDAGLRVSIDSFNPVEVEQAVRAGAELVLSVNSSNLDAARDWGCEVVLLPDEPATLGGLDISVEKLTGWGVPFRIDPILEPIGFGFAASLGRFLEVRRRYPQAELFMGVGNLTELTDVDSAGVNVMLLGFCQEVGVRGVLTTEVINWCRSSVRELALARKLVHRACTQRVLPKRLAPDLVMLRDPKPRAHGDQTLRELAANIRDRNFRLFAERGLLHMMNGSAYRQGVDPFALFRQFHEQQAIDPAHAFYLGYELAKAVTALTLGKEYVQDQALSWGLLTVPEESHRAIMKDDAGQARDEPGDVNR
ncbi:MAG: dihydropteroate synthase [Planctomycetia bacterium]|nr:dihydropteroate synthase [Planctomycetia bacterium]